jgi:hypothetical protein
MAFVNEKVPEQDIDKYGMREINKKHWVGDCCYEWTIDKEKDIFLRYLRHGDRDTPYRNDFSFYWKGTQLTIRFEKHGEGMRGGKGSTTWEFGGWQPPENLKPHLKEIIADLKEALTVYKDFGIGSTIADHTAYFDF